MKYVMVMDKAVTLIGTPQWPEGGQIACSDTKRMLPLIFAEEFTHSVVVEQLRQVYPGLVSVSAGFCEQNEDGWFCEGRSTSLGLHSFGTLDASVIGELMFKSLNEDEAL